MTTPHANWMYPAGNSRIGRAALARRPREYYGEEKPPSPQTPFPPRFRAMAPAQAETFDDLLPPASDRLAILMPPRHPPSTIRGQRAHAISA